MNPLPIFIISGKSPTEASGGYAAYARHLALLLTQAGYPVFCISQGESACVRQTEVGEEHILHSRLSRTLPLLNIVSLAALPFFSRQFAVAIGELVENHAFGRFVVWGMGPWAYGGVAVKRRYGQRALFFASYFTTLQHELAGSVEALSFADYGLLRPLQYRAALAVARTYYTFLERRIVRTADRLVTHYASTERILEQELHAPPSLFRRMTYGVEMFERSGNEQHPPTLADVNPRGSFTLLIISRQDPRKGIHILLKAFALLRHRVPRAQLIVIGSGILLEAHRRLAKRLGIEGAVQFLGFVADPTPYLQVADVYVFSSFEEGSGALSLLEAMKAGKAIVTTACDGIPEDIEHERHGLLVPVGDARAFADAIVRLADDPALRARLGQEAMRRYNERFGLDKMKDDIQRVIAECETATSEQQSQNSPLQRR